MKYEENVWYGWNGGECPVHPDTVVQVQMGTVSVVEIAKCWRWDHRHEGGGSDIIAFRVIKEHKEPREFLVCDGQVFASEIDARNYGGTGCEIIHVKEVLE